MDTDDQHDPKIFNRLACTNCVDPNQTAPLLDQSDLDLHSLPFNLTLNLFKYQLEGVSKYLGKSWYQCPENSQPLSTLGFYVIIEYFTTNILKFVHGNKIP